jgi:integrase
VLTTILAALIRRIPQRVTTAIRRRAPGKLKPMFSTLMASLGVEAKVVQELMRHASFRTTMDNYTQALDEPKRQAQERLADLIMRTGKVGHA